MRSLLRNLVESARRLTGPGAVRNARMEVDHTTRSVVDLERQLGRITAEVPPRQAA